MFIELTDLTKLRATQLIKRSKGGHRFERLGQLWAFQLKCSGPSRNAFFGLHMPRD